ncbi:bifunctional UDP-N-acetylglucosamine diphosphorylase/glucosamine-1-phosphate N-acetyltransferase GlmU [Thermanaeromonas sp.]|uniref:bifunctional UDP-N-acetylglucosamine diphosphorylase/glucosamine-1-phosphate N-acetyltransferase GlmU n=1 Tax=Thermanaeromonas sp. TaxID=2003697 RepID=UPI00261A8CB4|nr:bifunctional UDP-N-acetylglucosamine diphosphorylase/glucosamine-1-phosphate N-acetyltransferase GlmU [Thermanaeromonas sp.]
MEGAVAVVLAAGEGKRMRSDIPKVLHRVAGRALVEHVLAALEGAGLQEIVVVVGHGGEAVRSYLGSRYKYAWQERQLGTGHALAQARELAGGASTLLVLCGDTPLLRPSTLVELLKKHREEKAAASILVASLEDPTGYGRVVRGPSGRVERIVEEKDAGPQEKAIKEVNSGTYCFDASLVWPALEEIKPLNAQGEYYLTDVIELFCLRGEKVLAVECPDPEEILGVNDRVDLARAARVLRRRINEELMRKGVTIVDPATTFVDAGVEVGRDTILLPFTFLEGKTTIGSRCTVGPQTTVRDSSIGEETCVSYSVVLGSAVGARCQIGPFAYLRPGTVLADRVKVGDFVEIKASRVGEDSKVPHLTYLGDAEVGKNVNIGAGTITCNYDGHRKWTTVIGDGAFIGSNTNLVAPVEVGEKALVGAGSTITKNVPAGALALARAEQVNIPEKGRARLEKKERSGEE